LSVSVAFPLRWNGAGKKRPPIGNERVVRNALDIYAGLEVEKASEHRTLTLGFSEKRKRGALLHAKPETAFGCPRDFLDNRFVYVVVSSRARGLSVGVNLNPDRSCNFKCVYCEAQNGEPVGPAPLDPEVMARELRHTLDFVLSGRLRERIWFHGLQDELLQLRHVTLSGDGEPTLAENFVETVQAVVHVRARGEFPFFKIVLITNGVGLDQDSVRAGLKYLTQSDEIWVKLDGGTQEYLNRVNGADVPLEKILTNIRTLARTRPVVVQSLFPSLHGQEPPPEEIEQYALRLKELAQSGARIPLVQIYSATRPTPNSDCGHLSLKALSHIAETVRQISGLKAEVF
jgi:wyosine [tRNA(Phe)-imidazoG37] synthetase (radical SAM superfamily)